MNAGAPGFEAHARDIYAWAYRVLGHHHDALDVVQDVFLRWSRQCTRQPPEQPRGWLRRATLNRAMDVLRTRQTRRGEAGDGQQPVADAASPDAAADLGALRAEIQAVLSELTDVQRAVLIAKVYDEMTFAEIAGELGVAVPTAKTHYLRAVRAVRDRLRGRWAPEDA